MHLLLLYTLKDIARASTYEIKLRKLLGKQTQPARIIFNEDRFTHARPLLKTLNALNVFQISLLQILLFMHKIKTGRCFGFYLVLDCTIYILKLISK